MENRLLEDTSMKLINVILDSRRVEKYDLLIAELKRQGLTEADYEIWPCLLFPTVVQSISASHKMIVRQAKEEGVESIIVAEDDLMFLSADGWKYYRSKKPSYFDLYLGGCYSELKDGLDNERYMYTREPIGLHLYEIHSRYYDKFLATDEAKHIDTEQRDGIFKVCYPMVALQRPGFSSNNMAWADYNTLLKPEDIFKG